MKTQTFEEHKVWLDEQFPNELLSAAKTRYENASTKALRTVMDSIFWQSLLANSDEWRDSYSATSRGYQLFPSEQRPILVAKRFDSLIDKVYRKNVIQNSNWPNPPEDGWIKQDNWYEKINDIVRTTIVVKYMDGVEHLTSSMASLCSELNFEFDMNLEARAEGYYAAHCYVDHKVDIPKVGFDTEMVNIKLEIQVATQLQDAIRKLTHQGYVANRSKEKSVDKWQWDYKDPNFTPNYLGHILHYVEGTIMEIRERGRQDG
jgi:hypothetical protein